jgi:hypothetical protein
VPVRLTPVRFVIAVSCAAALLVTANARAAMPMPGAHFLFHDHRTAGDGWHIEMVVGKKDPRFLRQLVLYSERCSETILTTHVRIRDDGTIATTKMFTTAAGGQGTWRLDARWTDMDHVTGSFQITRPGCDGGVRSFTAGTEEHGHQGHVHVAYGTPVGSYPDLTQGGTRALAQVRRLWRDSMRAARQRLSSYSGVLALGYTPWARKSTWTPPMVFHVRSKPYERDGRTLDPLRPESLVYWWPRKGEPVLVAFMYRAPTGLGWPEFGKPLLGWHAHGHKKAGPTIMTHVWMTRDLRSAIANCMPVQQLEAANRRFRFTKTTHQLTKESRPCRSA